MSKSLVPLLGPPGNFLLPDGRGDVALTGVIGSWWTMALMRLSLIMNCKKRYTTAGEDSRAKERVKKASILALDKSDTWTQRLAPVHNAKLYTHVNLKRFVPKNVGAVRKG